jgi:hypothetical protein
MNPGRSWAAAFTEGSSETVTISRTLTDHLIWLGPLETGE